MGAIWYVFFSLLFALVIPFIGLSVMFGLRLPKGSTAKKCIMFVAGVVTLLAIGAFVMFILVSNTCTWIGFGLTCGGLVLGGIDLAYSLYKSKGLNNETAKSNNGGSNNNSDYLEQLRQLKAMLDEKLINEEEFTSKKNEIMKRM